ncbi:MAG: hypothetical protein ACP5G8_07845, partial [Athalassotoga sp.]
MAKVYDIKSFESHLVSRGLADNSVKAFVSDIRQFLDSELDPESYLLITARMIQLVIYLHSATHPRRTSS